jgi:hypothetical protein
MRLWILEVCKLSDQRKAMNREKLITKLLKELPELLADYEHCAQDESGKVLMYSVGSVLQRSGLLF